mmetsp:Transcript_47830/g.35060  ORF Transcript_47830/g.35060 Transcript_47830/m.35060 type:complete len:194 (+) Transcript_47830:470-1051(+)
MEVEAEDIPMAKEDEEVILTAREDEEVEATTMEINMRKEAEEGTEGIEADIEEEEAIMMEDIRRATLNKKMDTRRITTGEEVREALTKRIITRKIDNKKKVKMSRNLRRVDTISTNKKVVIETTTNKVTITKIIQNSMKIKEKNNHTNQEEEVSLNRTIIKVIKESLKRAKTTRKRSRARTFSKITEYLSLRS